MAVSFTRPTTLGCLLHLLPAWTACLFLAGTLPAARASADEDPEQDLSEAVVDALGSLPMGGTWEPGGAAFEGTSLLGAFPPVTRGPAEVVLAAVNPAARASLISFGLDEPLAWDRRVLERLAVAAHSAFSGGWGAPFRTVGTELADEEDLRLLRLRGTVGEDGEEKSALVTWLPHDGGHHVVIAMVSPEHAEQLPALERAVVGLLPQSDAKGARTAFRHALPIALVAVCTLVVFFGLLVVRRRAR